VDGRGVKGKVETSARGRRMIERRRGEEGLKKGGILRLDGGGLGRRM